MMLGEGEVQLPDVCDTIIQGRREGLTKREILKRLCHIEGVYVPAFYDVSYRPDGRVEAITAKEGAPAVVRKAIIQDMNSQPLPENFVVPMIGAVHDRAQIEVLRGCVRGCRFVRRASSIVPCVSGMRICSPRRGAACAEIQVTMRSL